MQDSISRNIFGPLTKKTYSGYTENHRMTDCIHLQQPRRKTSWKKCLHRWSMFS